MSAVLEKAAPVSAARARVADAVPAGAKATAREARARADAAPRDGEATRWSVSLLLGLPLAVTALGLPYYLAGTAVRVRSPLHPILKSSGLVGQSLGVLGLAIFLFLWLYPLRKRFARLSFTGSVGAWMRVHTIAGAALPVLVAVHATWRFRGLIGLGYWAMLVVWASGLVGRFLYGRIPRSRNGLELSREEITGHRRALVTEIAAALDLDPREVEGGLAVGSRAQAASGLWPSARRLVADGFARRRVVRTLRRRWSRRRADGSPVDRATLRRVLRLARREIALGQAIRLLDATHRLFRYWHAAHRPVAVTALLAVLVHVAVAVALGQTWLR